MATLIQTNSFTASAPQWKDLPPPSYDEVIANKETVQPTAPAQSLEEALIKLGQTSDNKYIRNIALYHIMPKQPRLATKFKNFFTEKWTATKAYPQAGANKVKNIFHSIYYHPTVPYIGAGLLGAATGLFMGLSIPAGFMLGVAVKLGSIGLDKGLDAANRVFKGSKSQTKNISQSSFNQTIRTVPVAIFSFSLGLNSYNLALVAKIATAAVVIGAGAFAIGTTVHAQ